MAHLAIDSIEKSQLKTGSGLFLNNDEFSTSPGLDFIEKMCFYCFFSKTKGISFGFVQKFR